MIKTYVRSNDDINKFNVKQNFRAFQQMNFNVFASYYILIRNVPMKSVTFKSSKIFLAQTLNLDYRH